jgi:hypothetical protein
MEFDENDLLWGFIGAVVIVGLSWMFSTAGAADKERRAACKKAGGTPIVAQGYIRACAKPGTLIEMP